MTTMISDVQILNDKEVYTINDRITLNVKFSIAGDLRDSFTEENWTKSYEKYDNCLLYTSPSPRD